MPKPTAQSTIEIAAPPELVYDIVSNVPELPKWAAETDRCRWIGGADGPAVGARFQGRNRHTWRVWSTVAKVTHADPGRRFGFQVYVYGVPSATWRYTIEPIPGGSRVTESTLRVTPRPIAMAVNAGLLGIPDRDAHNQRNIERTLAQLKTYAESLAANHT
ncbi:MAG: SRPBCC family protein [Micromonosporaceae bacterium]